MTHTTTITEPRRACERGGLAQARTHAALRRDTPMKNRTSPKTERSDGRPPLGNTGGKSTNTLSWDSRIILLHWLRSTFPATEHERIRNRLVELFGEPDEVRGKWFYQRCERFRNNILLLSARRPSKPSETLTDDLPDDNDHICIDVPGGALDDLEHDERLSLARFLIIGGRVTRIDIAADAYHTDRVGLIDCATESCFSQHLCGAKRWKQILEFDSGLPSSRGIVIGLRGNKGSGRYIRIYDKGLETGEAPEGTWERVECEFSADAANEAASDIFSCEERWEWRAWARLNGAISFREPGDESGLLARRPYCDWWQKWLDGSTPSPTIPRRLPTRLQAHVDWLANTVLPTVATLANDAEIDVAHALELLCLRTVKPRKHDKSMRVMLAEWREAFREYHSNGPPPKE